MVGKRYYLLVRLWAVTRNVGQKIKELRKARGTTQEELAFALRVSRQIVSRWETGLSVPSGENLSALAKYFGVSIETLIEGEGIPFDSAKAKKNAKIFFWVSAIVFCLGVAGLIASFAVFYFDGKPNEPSSTITFTPLGFSFALAATFVLVGVVLLVYSLLKRHTNEPPKPKRK
jgi:transcriptional regulator with XRE-family HTH domain